MNVGELIADAVEYLGTSVSEDDTGDPRTITVAYKLGKDWMISVEADLGAGTQTDIARLTVGPVDGRHPVDGINSGLLRMIPFRHAKARVQAEVVRSWSGKEAFPAIPGECSSAADYAQLAMAFQWFSDNFPDQPVQKMHEASEINKNTLAARISKVKALGFVARDRATGRYRSTRAAEVALHG